MTTQYQAFRVLLRMQIHPGMERDFKRTWLDIGNAIAEHPANLRQWLMKSAEEEHTYYIMSDWIDEPQFRQFELSDAHLEHRKRLFPFRVDISMTTMHIVYTLDDTKVVA
jgi:heme-degrading monooxygenase HmoA